MSDSLIEQVEKLADSQKCGALFDKLTRIYNGTYASTRFYFDFPALLAHLERTQAVVDAAREAAAAAKNGFTLKELSRVMSALDAALENFRSDNDGK